jgi:hypothetical protein
MGESLLKIHRKDAKDAENFFTADSRGSMQIKKQPDYLCLPLQFRGTAAGWFA